MLTLLYFLSPCKTKLIPEGAGSLVVCVVDVTLRLAESHKLFRIDKTLRTVVHLPWISHVQMGSPEVYGGATTMNSFQLDRTAQREKIQ